MRAFSLGLMVLTSCFLTDGPPYFIRGTARLPECSDAPAADLSGRWFDQGVLRITSEGCDEAPLDEELRVCALDWELTQDGNEVDLLVDGEYELRGRFCGDTLQLEGGWWLPVEAEGFGCTYEDEDAAEVVIDAGGATLTYASEGTRTGVLSVRERCTAVYDITLSRPSL